MGLTVEEYWANILPEYRKDLGNINLFVAVFRGAGHTRRCHQRATGDRPGRLSI